MTDAGHDSQVVGLVAQVHALTQRVGSLEKLAHPPVDLTGAIRHILGEFDRRPAITEHEAGRAGSAWDEMERWGASSDASVIERLENGFWTPWHLAAAAVAAREEEIAQLQESLAAAEATGVAIHLAWSKFGVAWECLEQDVQTGLLEEAGTLLTKAAADRQRGT